MNQLNYKVNVYIFFDIIYYENIKRDIDLHPFRFLAQNFLYQDNKEVVLLCVKKYGKSLQYVSPRLQNDTLALTYAKYSDQPKALTPEQDAIVMHFLQEKKNTYDSFKKTMVTSRLSQTNGLSGLTRHGPHFYKQFLERMYAMNGLNEEIIFILNKMNPRGGRSKTKRKIKNKRKSKSNYTSYNSTVQSSPST